MKTILSLGAGVQSSTLALMAAHGEVGPMPDCAIFADVQAESPKVYEWLDWLEEQLPYPVIRVTHGDLKDESTDVRKSKTNGKIYWRSMVPYFSINPERSEIVIDEDNSQIDAWGNAAHEVVIKSSKGMLQRHCTVDYKIRPINRALKALMKEAGDKTCDQWLGISLDEIQRMKENREPRINNKFPLIKHRITRQDCKDWMQRMGYPEPPRSACYFCPYHSDDEWMQLKNEEPKLFTQAAEYEKVAQASAAKSETLNGVPFLHRSCVPLAEVDFKAAKIDSRQLSFLDECEGMCGV